MTTTVVARAARLRNECSCWTYSTARNVLARRTCLELFPLKVYEKLSHRLCIAISNSFQNLLRTNISNSPVLEPLRTFVDPTRKVLFVEFSFWECEVDERTYSIWLEYERARSFHRIPPTMVEVLMFRQWPKVQMECSTAFVEQCSVKFDANVLRSQLIAIRS